MNTMTPLINLRLYPTYKPSGVPWLGDVPAHWIERRGKWLFHKMERTVRETDDVITCFRDGVVTLRKNRRTEGFTEALQEFGYQGIRKGDLVIHAMDAFAGAAGVSDSDGKGSPVYSVCSMKPPANAHYYAFIVREMARNQWVAALARGVRERSTDFRYAALADQLLPLPPLSEQAAIVRYLDHADRRIRRYIDGKERLIALLEEEKQAIINQAVTRGLDPNVPLKPSGVEWLGDVPEHWELRRLGASIAKAVTGIWGDDPDGIDDLPCVRVADFDRAKHRVRLHDPTMRAVTPTERIRRVLKRGDLLFEKSGGGDRQPVGVVVLYDHDLEAVCSNFISKLTPSDGHDPEFLTYLHSDLYAVGVNNAAIKQTTGIQNIDAAAYLAELVAFPPLSEQVQIVAYLSTAVGNVDTAIAAARRQIELLREYRTRLISDVVTGKLDVREAAANLPDESDE